MKELWNTLMQQFGWLDLLDILILSVVGFRLYIWLRGTMALHAVAGLIGLGVASLVATRAGLVLTTYVLQAISAVAIILIIVVFQSEIRHGLRTASAIRWWQNRKRQRESDEETGRYADLALGLSRLANKRIGALIIVPGFDPLDDYLTGGIEQDARLTPELLEAAFHTGSPIHDGAMVLKGSRIVVAGTVLPLSGAPDLPDALGTRHRAAIGLSERCDAAVLVVSEERGKISIARNGELRVCPGTSEREVIAWLNKELTPTSAPKVEENGTSRLPAPRQILAFAIVVTLVFGAWFAVVADRSEQRTVEVLIELREVPERLDVKIVRPRNSRVLVRLQGSPRLLNVETIARVQAWIDLKGSKLGYSYVDIELSVPRGVRLVGLTPERARVRIRTLQTGHK